MNFDTGEYFLKPGIHKMTWKEFYELFSFSDRRKELLEGLKQVLDILKRIGATNVYIDGSFVTREDFPGDWDACFDAPDFVLEKIRENYPFLMPDKEKTTKKLYKGELFFAFSKPIKSRNINFLDFFQQRKDNPKKKKGIVELII